MNAAWAQVACYARQGMAGRAPGGEARAQGRGDAGATPASAARRTLPPPPLLASDFIMLTGTQDYDEEDYVDVRTLPLKPPQPMVPPEKPARRPWHPVMWDSSIVGIPPPDNRESGEEPVPASREYPHKQRIRNLRRLIADGKVKPTSETLIFFLCNKFAASEDRQRKAD